MGTDVYSVLVVEDNVGDSRYLQEIIKDQQTQYLLSFAETLKQALEKLATESFDVMLLDLGLPDSKGLDTFYAVHQAEIKLPIIVLSGLNDEEVSLKAVQEGAQDYLIKGEVNGNQLSRAIRYAIERYGLQEKIYHVSVIDQLTGLYNRSGFYKQLEQEMSAAAKLKRRLYLMFADLDNMKQINDQFGHREGDLALIQTAELLRSVFQPCDILARLGGDEFVALIVNEPESMDEIIAKLNRSILQYRDKPSGYTFSVSYGFAEYNPEKPCTLDDFMMAADSSMYKAKRMKKANA